MEDIKLNFLEKIWELISGNGNYIKRKNKYYEIVLKPFVKENSPTKVIDFLESRIERDDDCIPKYIFYLMQEKREDDLVKILRYDYCQFYSNEENDMIGAMEKINKLLLRLLFLCSLISLVLFSISIVCVFMTLVSGDLKRAVFCLIVGLICFLGSLFLAKLTTSPCDDIYTIKKEKMEKLIAKKVKAYDKKWEMVFI